METLETIETKIDKLIEQNKKAIETTEEELVKQTKPFQTLKPNLYRLKKKSTQKNMLKQKVTYGRQNVQKNFMRDV